MASGILYYAALLPPEPVLEDMNEFRRQFSRRFNTRHALKSPAHITVQKPFKRPVQEEKRLTGMVADLNADFYPVEVSVTGFGHFGNRGVYYKIDVSKELDQTYQRIHEMFRKFGLKPDELHDRFNPHITIATRDFNPAVFDEAWSDLQQSDPAMTFVIDRVTLFKYINHSWVIISN